MTNYYCSGRANSLRVEHFAGVFSQVSAAATLGLDFGGTVSIAHAPNNRFILGLGVTLGVGLPFPASLTGNLGSGASTIWKLN